jgi:SH3-like domain-containing protein
LNVDALAGYRDAMRSRRTIFLAAVALACAAPASADTAKTPYWASIRSSEVNLRVGPGEDYRIAWIYRRAQLPLKVLRIMDGWRLVQDPDGAQGWMRAQFLTRQRTGYVRGQEPADMRESPSGEARLLWRLAPGVVGLLGDCQAGWCAFAVGERKGHVEARRLWGAGEP